MYRTGYFARATEGRHKAYHTQVHIYKDGKPLCNYRPHDTMKFQWCADGVRDDYIECDKCRKCLPKR